IEIVFDGADRGAFDKTPDFIKSIPLWKANEETALVAYEMNGEPLPHWNGFPARLVVPGWTATYWVKHLTSIKASTKPLNNFWMSSAYRVPLGKFPMVARFTSQETAVNTPITEIMVNSIITSHQDGATVKVGLPLNFSGIAWDAGYGIRSAELSVDGGRTWSVATLGDDLGPFAFRSWSHGFTAQQPGRNIVMVRATNGIGQTQTSQLISNPAGYHHNVMQAITVIAV
ncbi:MAG TPA: molybdopterin-dependent oxidoreductase, partial [Xanthobacteraceae bacterium]|nr:molybdopterin-dependent oxidoreductase [Xanthobacteraceae bacterium]